MAVFKRGSNWHYEFEFKGQRIRESTRQGNKRVAEQMEAARRTQLAKGEVGIEERKPAPTLREFAPRFEKLVSVQCAEKPKTVAFYLAKLKTLLHDSELGSVRLDAIGEAAVERYIQTRSRTVSRRKRVLSPGSINRELATLRKLLRVAHEWKEIQRIPRIRLLRGERNRDFVLSRQQETIYLAACPDPLADIAMILLDTGLRLGELLSLEWPQARLEPLRGAKFGYLTVLREKAKNGKSRNVPLSERAIAVLRKWGPHDRRLAVAGENGLDVPQYRLDQQHARVRKLLKMPTDFVLHSLRHTFGTRLGNRALIHSLS